MSLLVFFGLGVGNLRGDGGGWRMEDGGLTPHILRYQGVYLWRSVLRPPGLRLYGKDMGVSRMLFPPKTTTLISSLSPSKKKRKRMKRKYSPH